jgi:hypothetical protein
MSSYKFHIKIVWIINTGQNLLIVDTEMKIKTFAFLSHGKIYRFVSIIKNLKSEILAAVSMKNTIRIIW